jgi:alpha-1,3-rhamnosyltransferase
MSASDQPLVSVIMPAYNHERFVEEAIRSVWAQTYTHCELIVLDDGSKDATGAIAERLREISPMPMTVIRKENEGLSRTLNQGLALARGEYVTLCASDDRFLPHRVATLLPALQRESGEVGLAYGDGYMITSDGGRTGGKFSDSLALRSGWIFEDLLFSRCSIPAPTVLYRAAVFRTVGGFDEHLYMEDRDMFLRIARRFAVSYVPECVAEYRLHPEQTSATATARLIQERLEAFERNVDHVPGARDEEWRRRVTADYHLLTGMAYYDIRELKKARRWLWRSLSVRPLRLAPWTLICRSLLGRSLIGFLSKRRLQTQRHSGSVRQSANP